MDSPPPKRPRIEPPDQDPQDLDADYCPESEDTDDYIPDIYSDELNPDESDIDIEDYLRHRDLISAELEEGMQDVPEPASEVLQIPQIPVLQIVKPTEGSTEPGEEAAQGELAEPGEPEGEAAEES